MTFDNVPKPEQSYEYNLEMNGVETATKCINFIYSKSDKVEELTQALQNLQSDKLSLAYLETMPSRRLPGAYEYKMECEKSECDNLRQAIKKLQEEHQEYQIISRKDDGNLVDSVPWFPRSIKELDRFVAVTDGSVFELDHPGFEDEAYKKRRKHFADIAKDYKHGDRIPRVEYTEEERNLWKMIFQKLTSLYKTNACKEHRYIFPLLMQNCGYREDNIPQLEDVSNFLKDCTGFTLRPVAGLLPSRDFLAGLAFRVLHSTQYLRHPGRPWYTSEPDVFHELQGHAPLFADPAFARFSQEIGLASLGAPDEYIEKLSTLYWFTAEFGMCREGDGVKAYGAGLLSGFGELQYCLTDEPELKEFDPPITCQQKYPFEGYQPIYHVAKSFEDAQVKMLEFAKTIPKPFTLQYDPFTQSVNITDICN